MVTGFRRSQRALYATQKADEISGLQFFFFAGLPCGYDRQHDCVRQILWTLGGIFDEDGGRIQRLVFRWLQIHSSPVKVSKRNADANTACEAADSGARQPNASSPFMEMQL
jgi:hypothetical protein